MDDGSQRQHTAGQEMEEEESALQNEYGAINNEYTNHYFRGV